MSRFGKCFLGFLTVLLLMAAQQVNAQDGRIRGMLLLNQNPIGDEMIMLRDAEGRICNGTMTDETGSFTFEHIAPGTYTVVGRYKDFEAEVECTLSPGEEMPVTLNCKRKTLFQWIPDKSFHPAPHPVYS